MKALLIEKLHQTVIWPFQKWRKASIAWNDISCNTLLNYPEGTLGFNLGCFLIRNNFELQPKFEDHDVIHVLTGIGVTVPEEIGMHYYMLGNGNWSLYSMVITIRGGILPSIYDQGNRLWHFHILWKLYRTCLSLCSVLRSRNKGCAD